MPSVTHVFFVVVPVDVIYSLFFLNVFAASSFAAKIMTIIIINNTRLYLYRYRYNTLYRTCNNITSNSSIRRKEEER